MAASGQQGGGGSGTAPYQWPEDVAAARREQARAQRARTLGLAQMDPLELGRQWYPEQMRTLEEYYQCAHCNQTFQELNNLGRWLCRYHPGRLGYDHRWSCCGRSTDWGHPRYEHPEARPGLSIPGCLPCDHRSAQVPQYIGVEQALVPAVLQPLVVPRCAPGALLGQRRLDDGTGDDDVLGRRLVVARARRYDAVEMEELREREESRYKTQTKQWR